MGLITGGRIVDIESCLGLVGLWTCTACSYHCKMHIVASPLKSSVKVGKRPEKLKDKICLTSLYVSNNEVWLGIERYGIEYEFTTGHIKYGYRIFI